MAEAILHELNTYASRFHNTVAQFIATSPIMDLCLASDQRPGPRVSKRWWYQDGVDVEGMRTAAWEAEQTEEGRGQTGQRQRHTKLLGG